MTYQPVFGGKDFLQEMSHIWYRKFLSPSTRAHSPLCFKITIIKHSFYLGTLFAANILVTPWPYLFCHHEQCCYKQTDMAQPTNAHGQNSRIKSCHSLCLFLRLLETRTTSLADVKI